MIQPISFNSNYLVKSSNNKTQQKKFVQFSNYANSIVQKAGGCSAIYSIERRKNSKTPNKEFVILQVPDKLDRWVDSYCLRNDILFKKYSSDYFV